MARLLFYILTETNNKNKNMKIRIKPHYLDYTLYYNVQIKGLLFWKTVSSSSILDNAIADVKELKRMEEFNKTNQ